MKLRNTNASSSQAIKLFQYK